MSLRPPLTPAALRSHLLEVLLPLWHERGLDRHQGGYHNCLGPDLIPRPDGYKRLVAQTRQIYALSHGLLLGGGVWMRSAALDLLQFVWDRFGDREQGGFCLTVTPEGAPLDRRKDAYAHAFVLFAMAYLHRATGEPAALEVAERSFDLLEGRLADRAGGGYFEYGREDWVPVKELRRQNPHMHLLEAFLALYEVTRGDVWREAAERMVLLLRERLFDAEAGVLREYFAPDWDPHPGREGDVVEPGHHLEWVWLLHRYARVCAAGRVPAEAEPLFAFALQHGVDPRNGGIADELDPRGRIVRATQRIWPQTELLQALAARLEARWDPELRAQLERELARVFSERVRPDGAWREYVAPDGSRVPEALPVTSVYHVLLALSEVARVLEHCPPR